MYVILYLIICVQDFFLTLKCQSKPIILDISNTQHNINKTSQDLASTTNIVVAIVIPSKVSSIPLQLQHQPKELQQIFPSYRIRIQRFFYRPSLNRTIIKSTSFSLY